MVYIVIYALIVIGGWMNLRPSRCQGWRTLYQLPVNLFVEADRSICDIFNTGKRETLSSWAARESKTWEIIFNILMLDPNHCRKYAGV